MKRTFGSLILLAVLTGCGNAAPSGYPLSVEEAYQRLVTSEMGELRDARQCGILIHLRPEGVPGQSVTWRVFSSGRELAHFTVKLIPTGTGVKTELTMSPGVKGGEAYDGKQFYPRPAFNQPLRPAVEEQVAALLEGRPMDETRIPEGQDSVCDVQRAGLESGRPFSVKDDLKSHPARAELYPDSNGWGAEGAGWRK